MSDLDYVDCSPEAFERWGELAREKNARVVATLRSGVWTIGYHVPVFGAMVSLPIVKHASGVIVR